MEPGGADQINIRVADDLQENLVAQSRGLADENLVRRAGTLHGHFTLRLGEPEFFLRIRLVLQLARGNALLPLQSGQRIKQAQDRRALRGIGNGLGHLPQTIGPVHAPGVNFVCAARLDFDAVDRRGIETRQDAPARLAKAFLADGTINQPNEGEQNRGRGQPGFILRRQLVQGLQVVEELQRMCAYRL